MIEAVFGEVRIRLHATCGHRVRSDQRRPRHSERGMTGTRLAIAEHQPRRGDRVLSNRMKA